MAYPSSVIAFSVKAELDTIEAAHVNDAQTEIESIEDGLLNGVAHHFKPLTDSTYDLGTTGVRFRAAYVDEYHGGGVNLTDLNATQLTSGTIPDARFPATLPATSGVNLTALNGSNIASGTVALARGGTGASLADPGADRIVFWDDSAGAIDWLLLGTGLSISDKTLNAVGKVGQWIPAAAAQLPTSNPATFDTRNTILVLDFDGNATNESAVFPFVLPSSYAGGGLSVDLYWMATSATSGNVKWDVQIERGTTDLDSDSFATEQSTTAAANGTSGIVTKTTITFTDGAQMDSWAAGEFGRIKVIRDTADAADTMNATDAELVGRVVRET
jgi:hypothetical protein